MAEAEKHGRVKWLAAEYLEKKQLEDTYPEMTAVFAQSFELLAPAVPAIRYALEPWALAHSDTDHKQLCMILSIANSLSRLQSGAAIDQLPLLEFQNRWLSESFVRLPALKKALFTSLKAAPK